MVLKDILPCRKNREHVPPGCLLDIAERLQPGKGKVQNAGQFFGNQLIFQMRIVIAFATNPHIERNQPCSVPNAGTGVGEARQRIGRHDQPGHCRTFIGILNPLFLHPERFTAGHHFQHSLNVSKGIALSVIGRQVTQDVEQFFGQLFHSKRIGEPGQRQRTGVFDTDKMFQHMQEYGFTRPAFSIEDKEDVIARIRHQSKAHEHSQMASGFRVRLYGLQISHEFRTPGFRDVIVFLLIDGEDIGRMRQQS